MKVKPKEVLVNLPVVLMFDSEEKVAEFASTINTIIHGKVKIKYEVVGQLQGQYAGLIYINRNLESQELREEFLKMIDMEELSQQQ
jgi:hypothetical protein